ncbi:MAG: YczE/YyaS/YitT family protein [Methanomethylophilus sp.]|jgi:uncharacterized membrane protein YczE
MAKRRYTAKQVAKRGALMLLGLYIMSMGVALSKLAGLGTSPISCIPAAMSYFTPLSMGMLTIILNTILVLLQIPVLGKRFQKFQLLQFFMGLGMGVFTDVNLWLLSFFDPANYLEQWIGCILSCVVLAFGLTLEIQASLLVAPGDGFVLACSLRTKIPVPRMKVINDVSMVIIGAVLSLVFTGGLNGVREGTIFSAIAVGPILGWFRRYLTDPIEKHLQ